MLCILQTVQYAHSIDTVSNLHPESLVSKIHKQLENEFQSTYLQGLLYLHTSQHSPWLPATLPWICVLYTLHILEGSTKPTNGEPGICKLLCKPTTCGCPLNCISMLQTGSAHRSADRRYAGVHTGVQTRVHTGVHTGVRCCPRALAKSVLTCTVSRNTARMMDTVSAVENTRQTTPLSRLRNKESCMTTATLADSADITSGDRCYC